MNIVKIYYEDESGLYSADIRDQFGSISSCTTGNATMHDIDKWLADHNVTQDEWNKAKVIRI